MTPAKPLTPPASVELTLAGGLQDALGNTMAAPPAWTFSVPRWIAVHGVVPAQPHAAYAGLPLLQLDSTGRPGVSPARAGTGWFSTG